MCERERESEIRGSGLRQTGWEGEKASLEPFTIKIESELTIGCSRDGRVIRLHGTVYLPFLPLRHL